ncbi:MAG: glycoside hydrolase family 44 protein [Chloroflexi bacterium]|nr:glycoside hydrolase family 44 protein [Chloroflexota bacterium]
MIIARRTLLAASALALCGLTGCSPESLLQPKSTAIWSSVSLARRLPAQSAQASASPATTPTGYAVEGIFIDATRTLRSISPLIYGLAGGDAALFQQVRPTLMRWGGNPSSRYNWTLGNAWNAGRDYFFENGNYGYTSGLDHQPAGVADAFVKTNRSVGAQILLTIPALGWVAKDDNAQSRSLNVPAGGGPALPHTDGAIAGYDPTTNRKRTSVPSLAKNGASSPTTAVSMTEWVEHCVATFGTASAGGLRYYAIDNEPDIWDVTHTDVHPARMGYDDMLTMFLDYASAIKQVDPSALVSGPVLSGWTGFFFSSLDRGNDNFRTAADRKAHGGVPFLLWWLQQVRQHDEKNGRRTLDVLDVHFYPQAGEYYPGGNSVKMDALRLRSTRSLWDPTYVDESWIARTPDETGRLGVVELVPRLRRWVDRYYPGTKIALTEWNWGADGSPNGALAVAEVLGIFGREGLDLGAYWQAPAAHSPGAIAFQAYRNYDGAGAAFGDEALQVAVTNTDRVSCYAARHTARGLLTAVTLNKHPTEPTTVQVRLGGTEGLKEVRRFQYVGAAGSQLLQLHPLTKVTSTFSTTLPPYSITVWELLDA